MMHKYRGEAALLLTVIIWGYGFVAVSQSLVYLTPFQMLFARFVIGVLATLVFFRKRIGLIDQDTLIKGAKLGTIQFIGFSFQTIGFIYTTPANNAFLTSVYVILVPLIALLLYKRKPDRFELTGAIIAMAGIFVLTYNSGAPVKLGDMLTLVCAVAYAFQIFYTTIYMKGKNPIDITIVMIATCMVLSGIATLVEGKPMEVPPPDGISAILFLALASTFFSTILQNYGQKYTTETRAAIFFSTEALWGTIFSVMFLGELITMKLVIGGILIFIAILAAELKISFSKQTAVEIKPNS